MADNGVTQAALAEQIGFTRAAVCMVVGGKSAPGRVLAMAIERATGGAVRAGALMGVG